MEKRGHKIYRGPSRPCLCLIFGTKTFQRAAFWGFLILGSPGLVTTVFVFGQLGSGRVRVVFMSGQEFGSGCVSPYVSGR